MQNQAIERGRRKAARQARAVLSPRRMAAPDVVCLSHLPWSAGLERPHQLMRRFARERHVFFVEQPKVSGRETRTVMRTVEDNVHVVSLQLPSDLDPEEVATAHRRCVGALASNTERPLLWVYAPLALHAARDLEPSLLVYDCVADHEASREAPPHLRASEQDLLARADVVFTAGTALFDAKRTRNVSTYPLPSSVDAEHFAPALEQASASTAVEHASEAVSPRLGFLGTIDARLDLGLVDRIAAAHPDVQIDLVGPLVGVTTWDLPDRPNVHWHGDVPYARLPAHVATWDVAINPYRSDAATRRSEPSGMLACLAAGKPVVSTPLDEVLSYAERGLVKVVDAEQLIAGVDGALREARDPVFATARRMACESLLRRTSWDRTANAMMRLVDEALMTRKVAAAAQTAGAAAAARARRDSERLLRSA